METLTILGMVIIAHFPTALCNTDKACERVAYEWGCTEYSPHPVRTDGGEPEDLYLCDRKTFNKHMESFKG